MIHSSSSEKNYLRTTEKMVLIEAVYGYFEIHKFWLKVLPQKATHFFKRYFKCVCV